MVLGPNNAFEWFQEMGFKTTFKAGYVKRIRPVCNAGLLLSNQTRNQEPTIRTVGLPELEMRIKAGSINPSGVKVQQQQQKNNKKKPQF